MRTYLPIAFYSALSVILLAVLINLPRPNSSDTEKIPCSSSINENCENYVK